MVTQKLRKLKPYTVLLFLVLFAVLYYFFSFLIPFTNNAFVVANVRPVAAIVSGYITDLYVKNEQYVQKGQPLFTVFQEPYKLTYGRLIEEVHTAKAELQSLQYQLQKEKQLLIQYTQEYNRIHLNYFRNKAVLKSGAISEINVKDLQYENLGSLAKVNMQTQQISMVEKNIQSLHHKIKALIYKMRYAKVNLEQTTVYAQSNGRIQNMYLSLGTPIEINKPIFSFVDTESLYIQANFTELDLRMVKTGNKVYIIPRMYFGTKLYHGTVVSGAWAANRQITNPKTQLQTVTNDTNNWVLLPQRFPVQIKITDYDSKHYPLPIGATCYVIIQI
ncbi:MULTISPECIES: HlyD family secretion protein [Legionella]|uniref:HlyD family secretion protein n=1 Tax=Legionella resiliens TaxID=2905958 RepID=A0ABS8X5A2_9GAMM|nr:MULTISPECIES: HlyD family secretion protein [unclassified Legionella]MCE0723603.1 HlyD family secretion protein [Legionella sp. 9fVS26]MCE3532757.1 HlyD family secretion protein [Legionella sp. 8cVS16]QLZ68892.1 HlyD family secretion protein [Legionella sp. PC1000]